MVNDGVKALHGKWMKIMLKIQTLHRNNDVPSERVAPVIMVIKAFTQDLEKLMKDD